MGFITINNERYYKIENAQDLSPFFIQVASASDIWIFLSSNGGVTAGRMNADNNIFPYETDDRLHLSYDTGSRTYIKCTGQIWQPFQQNPNFDITRNIYKSYYGNSVIIEEVNNDLNLSYSYHYKNSEEFGVVKTSNITNLSTQDTHIEVLDGLMNIQPYGVNSLLQATCSTLVDAYKSAELINGNLAVYSLTTQINDTPNPIEVLKANIAFNTLENAKVYLNTDIIDVFKAGKTGDIESDAFGRKSAYFVQHNATLSANANKEYSFVLDSGYDIFKIKKLQHFIASGKFSAIEDDVKTGTQQLIKIVESADGLQTTGDEIATAHHYLNTLYNVMRGGTFENGYSFDFDDFSKFVTVRNKSAVSSLNLVKDCKDVHELKEVASSNKVLYRLALEYLPLSFSRRHGDPSRPWNRFNINLKDENGDKISNYEGNWRDIFQNWEALGLSFPCYYENMVTKFVNASTIDGFNPYRINKEGIDWEKPEPENPFGGFGYWGDHQIIYLFRLLKGLKSHFPTKLKDMLSLDIFSYANVPYIITQYDKILENSKDTILFDFDKDEKIESLVPKIGSDAKLVLNNDTVYTVCLTEKLLVPLLSKMSNLLVGGGIWMNTARPEWNDANNAIVGIGLSMVTVYHVKTYINFMLELFSTIDDSYEISAEVLTWLNSVTTQFKQYENNYQGNEKALLDSLGKIFSEYRFNVYDNGFSGKKTVTSKDIVEFLKNASSAIDYTIDKNDNKVFETYNLLNDDFTFNHMQPMLEGQSAIIGSGCLDNAKITALFENMKSSLYSEKLRCHTLYPIVKTKSFVAKNILDFDGEIANIIEKDIDGELHFVSDIITADVLKDRISTQKLSDAQSDKLLALYEQQFEHKKFTGRSQVMYKFEGIGCVYWHQNAKLALALLESVVKAKETNDSPEKLYALYNELMQGFIYRKTPTECNAIPVEPYSHTSFQGKSEQPGMTGQVKESVIMRRLELGVQVIEGKVQFNNWFVKESDLSNNELQFSIYSIPVEYKKTGNEKIEIHDNGSVKVLDSNTIDGELSDKIFKRSKEITKIVYSY